MRIWRLHIALLFLLFSSQVYSQSCAKVGEAIKAYQAKDIVAAKKAIDIASLDETCAKDPSTWYYKSFFNKDYYRTKENTLKKSPSRDLGIAAARKNLELDPANKYAAECKNVISFFASSFYNDAVSEMNNQKYQASYDSYVQYLETIKYNPSAKLDTAALFYAGYTAFMANNMPKAKEYLIKATEYKYKDANVYYYLGKTYLASAEKEKAYKTFEMGTKLFPENKELILTQVNLYIEDDKLKELEKLLDKAIQLDPKNTEVKLNLAVVFEKLMATEQNDATKYFDKAEKLYLDIIKVDGNNFKPNFNLAVLYYNKAINIIDNTDPDKGIPEINVVQEKCAPIFQQSLPHMLKAYKINPKRKEVLEGLAGIYFALNDIPKSNEFKQKADAIK